MSVIDQAPAQRSLTPADFIAPPMAAAHVEALAEGRRQLEICNACRYCEGYCAVFPAMMLRRTFTDGEVDYIANLCHNCQACYHACQYAPPHEFALNLPKALAEIRSTSWQRHSWPQGAFRLIGDRGLFGIGLLVALATAAFWFVFAPTAPGAVPANGFYALVPHATLVAIFAPVFVLALVMGAVGVARFWRATGSPAAQPGDVSRATHDAMTLRYLGGGHGEGCNDVAEDAFSNRRRVLHHCLFYGFLLCFASTSSGTILHYGFDQPAPYGLFSIPKLFGIPGGILMTIGAAGLLWTRVNSDPRLDARSQSRMGYALIAVLLTVAVTGLALYAARVVPPFGALLAPMLALHLGSVIVLFVMIPYSKLAHGFYRLAALARAAAERRTLRPAAE